MTAVRRVRVVAGLVERAGRILVTRRHDKGERPGLWEFPGGKVEAGEAEPAALARELVEELGVQVRVGELFGRIEHAYPDLHVELALYSAALEPGPEPQPLEAAELRWVPRGELSTLPFCEADLPLLERLSKVG
jgi:8-oxo-dGTP diphosphatase